MTGSDAWRWAKAAPVERLTLPAAAGVYTAAEIIHAAGLLTGADLAAPVAIAASVTYGRMVRRGGRPADRARNVAVGIAAAGGWAAAVAQYGAFAGPYHPLTLAYAAGALIGYRQLRHLDSVESARLLRAKKADWYPLSHTYGLGGSHLLRYEPTWLGERMLIDTRGTGRRSSSITRGGDVAEGIAEHLQLPASRVRVTAAGIAGRAWVAINHRDPWTDPLPHPVVGDVPGFDLPVPSTIKGPQVVGYVPETGKPITVTLWDERGAKSVLIVGMKGAGKSALLSCLRERITAASDALLWDINVAKGREDYNWSGACDLTAIASEERERALRILENAVYAIEWRAAQPRSTSDLEPSAKHPLIVITIDEVDSLFAEGDWIAGRIKKALSYIQSKGRSEAVSLIIAGQRGTVDWVGGANIRTQFDTFVIGKVGRDSEINNAVGEYAAQLPNMADYGDDQPGVWSIGAAGRVPQVGRSFNLTLPADLEWLARERAAWVVALEAGLVAHLGDRYADLKRTQGPAQEPAGPGGPGGPRATPQDGDRSPAAAGPGTATAVLDDGETSLEMLGRAVDDALPRELREQLERQRATAGDTRALAADAQRIRENLPGTDPAAVAAAARARWNQLAADTGPLPPEIEATILGMITGGGASGRAIARAFEESDINRNTVLSWLNRLRSEGRAVLTGKGRAARWMLPAEVTDSDDAGDAVAPSEDHEEG